MISFAFEAVGTNTGVPFGNYIYPESVNGPLLFGVPPLLTLAYIAMAYASLWIAGILLSRTGPLRGSDLFGVVPVAAALMVIWDLAIDPTQSTVEGHYVWANGGPYFGVPFENFIGWFLNGLVYFAGVVAYLANSGRGRGAIRVSRLAMLEPVALYALAGFAAAAPLLSQGIVSTIIQSMTLIALFGMGLPATVACLRLQGKR